MITQNSRCCTWEPFHDLSSLAAILSAYLVKAFFALGNAVPQFPLSMSCRVQELVATCKSQQYLTAVVASRAGATPQPHNQDEDEGAAAGPALDQLLQSASTAQAELAVARRRLTELEERVAVARADSVQAEVRAEASQLRVTTVRPLHNGHQQSWVLLL